MLPSLQKNHVLNKKTKKDCSDSLAVEEQAKNQTKESSRYANVEGKVVNNSNNIKLVHSLVPGSP